MHGIQDQRRTKVAYMPILGWIGIGSLPSILTVKEIHPLRASLMIPPVFLVAAIGAERIYAWLEQKTPWAFRITVIICFVVAVCWEPCQTYFRNWASDVHVDRPFEEWLVDEATEIRDAPRQPAKYVAIPRPVFLFPEVPQVILYLIQTSTKADRKQANIHYVFPNPNETWRSRDFCTLVKEQHPTEQVFCVSRAVPVRP